MKKDHWLTLICIVVVIALGAGLFFLLMDLGGKENEKSTRMSNDYESPLKANIAMRNAKTRGDFLDGRLQLVNGFCAEEFRQIQDIFMNAPDHNANREALEKDYKDRSERYAEEYGSDYKYSYAINAKEALDENELQDCNSDIQYHVKELKTALEKTKNYDSEDWDNLAEELGLSKAESKKFVAVVEELYNELKDAKITEGYQLEVTYILSGSKMDEPEKQTYPFTVYKINGYWVMEGFIYHFNELSRFRLYRQ